MDKVRYQEYKACLKRGRTANGPDLQQGNISS